MTKIKFCGMTRPLDIAAANEVGPDYIGFVFAEESPRFVPPEAAKSLTDGLSPDIPVFGVFRGVSFEDIVDIAKMDFIDAIQLHGDESNRFVRLLRTFTGLPIVKAFAVGPSFDREEAYASEADMILLDSGAGTGKTFDWELLKDFDREYILAGGLDPGNVGEAVARLHPAVVDTSSGIESDRRKDPEKMKQFKTAVVRADSLSNEEQR